MGRRCYQQGQSGDYVSLGKRVIVATSDAARRRDTSPGIEFSDDVIGAVRPARQQGQHCFVFGGGLLVHSFIAADGVDVLTVSIVPVLLGGGRSLFPGDHPTLNLRLTDYAIADGKVRLVYQRR